MFRVERIAGVLLVCALLWSVSNAETMCDPAQVMPAISENVGVALAGLMQKSEQNIAPAEYMQAIADIENEAELLRKCTRIYGLHSNDPSRKKYRQFATFLKKVEWLESALRRALALKDPVHRRMYIQNRLELGIADPREQIPAWDDWRDDYTDLVNY